MEYVGWADFSLHRFVTYADVFARAFSGSISGMLEFLLIAGLIRVNVSQCGLRLFWNP